MSIAFLVISFLCLLLAAHPFLTYPASLWLVRRFRGIDSPQRTTAVSNLSFALCFCAYNEERVIADKLRNIVELKRRMPQLSVYAYVDGATDRTGEILRDCQDFMTVVLSPDRRGKTYGMNHLVEMVDDDIVVFTDANVLLDQDALTNLPRYFADPRVGCVCGHLRYVNPQDSLTAATGSLYWRLEEAIKQLETDTGSAMGADGSIFAIRRRLHRPVPIDIIDDMYVSLSILCDGYRLVRAADVRAFERSAADTGEEFRRKIRIACQAFNVHRVLWPRLRRLGAWNLYKYLSHKFLRWISIYNLIIACALATAGLLLETSYGVVLGGWAAVLGASALGERTKFKPTAMISNLLTSLAGAGIGVWKSMSGERFQLWTPVASVRRSDR